jgi:hypothetical protein
VILIVMGGVGFAAAQSEEGKTWGEPEIGLAENFALPEFPGELRVYRIERPEVDENLAERLAKALGFAGVWEVGGRFVADENSRHLEVDRETGYLWYGEVDRVYGDPEGAPLVSPEEASVLAESFLVERGLLPENAELEEVRRDEIRVSAVDPETGKIWERGTGRGIVQVWFGRRIDHLEVVGSGCGVAVSLAGREVVGVRRCWKEYTPLGSFPLLAFQEIFADIRSKGVDRWLEGVKGVVYGERIAIRSVRLVYLDDSRIHRGQEFLLPVYGLTVDLGRGHLLEVFFPAVALPRVPYFELL